MWLLIIGILIDQVTKFLMLCNKSELVIIPHLLSFHYVENRGAAFGIAQGSNFIMAGISLVICIGIILFYIQKARRGEKVFFAWQMVLAGGIGNLIDRLVRGYVIDFIKTPFIATFNVADAFVVVGVILLLIQEIRKTSRAKKKTT